jgi:predicted RNase H-like HicB family nuclease
MENTFTAIIKKVGDNYVGFVAELPGANSQGKTIEETRENLKEAVAMVLQASREITESSLDGKEISEKIKIST